MNHDALNQWVAGSATVPGMISAGVRLDDGACLTKSFNETWPPEQLDKALQMLAAALKMLSNYGLAARWLTWTFAQGQIRIAAHSAGPLLALAAEPNTPAAQNLDSLTEEFLSRDFSN
jgi:hypothetical protein